jgi:hypothetical protein
MVADLGLCLLGMLNPMAIKSIQFWLGVGLEDPESSIVYTPQMSTVMELELEVCIFC